MLISSCSRSASVSGLETTLKLSSGLYTSDCKLVKLSIFQPLSSDGGFAFPYKPIFIFSYKKAPIKGLR